MDMLSDVTLTQDQHSLLGAIAHPWLDTGEWPLWANVQHRYDLRGQDADIILNSMPRVGIEGPFGASYGFVSHPRPRVGPGDRVRLTVAASLVLPQVKMMAGDPFVQALRHMIDLYTDRPITNELPTVHLRSTELASTHPSFKPWFVQVLPDLLSHEPAISTSGVNFPDGRWERDVTRSVMKYIGVDTVERYIEKTIEIVTANAAEITPAPVEMIEPQVSLPGRGPYVGLALLSDLEKAAQTSTWGLHKLIALCRELNENYATGNPYASAALIRAILDHIPPVFGHRDFKQVAAQHPFPIQRTDKAHAQRLAAFKDIAHDGLHRPISDAAGPTIGMDDLEPPARLNAILHELARLL
ncbi:hypothetical protein AVW11_00815 [Streptomyces amritsarensis]|uniref:Uncharacterized protein n=1 Tax=Streptomyces amritsarensis TaxID=681158 RepID=A0ABX3GC31_9ACTN|nr:hypothetical protein [Streptomyces amritsarensis]OLZ74040.1 hypothetical protein AVW11_00815 [Streptomyces amritsarensis]